MVKTEVFDTFSKEKYRNGQFFYKNMVKTEVFDTFSKEKYRKGQFRPLYFSTIPL